MSYILEIQERHMCLIDIAYNILFPGQNDLRDSNISSVSLHGFSLHGEEVGGPG